MPDIPPAGTFVGSWYYFFPSKTNKTECLISAHGGYHKVHDTLALALPGSKVHFYTEHGSVLKDPGLALMDNKPTPVETFEYGDGKTFVNYILSKFQGKHGNPKETYDVIAAKIKEEEDGSRQWQEQLLKASKLDDVKQAQEQLAKYHPMNVLTIRNRHSRHIPPELATLKNAIQSAVSVRPTLRIFHCSFCRALS